MTTATEVESKFDLSHTYEFRNLGEAFERAESTHLSAEERKVGHGEHFRALGAELDAIEDAPDRFEHTRTLPYPPKDETTAMRTMKGMQRKEPPRSQPTSQQHAANVAKAAQKAEKQKQKDRKATAK